MASFHGNIVVLGRIGVLMLGPSGSGKTRLSRLLIERWQARDLYASWVADDRFLIEPTGGQVMAKPPSNLQGSTPWQFWAPKIVYQLATLLS